MLRRAAAWALWAASLPALSAAVEPTALPAARPMCVDGWTLTAAAAQALISAAVSPGRSVSREDVVSAVLEDRAIGQHAQIQVGDDVLFEDGRVGYTLEVRAEAALSATLERALGAGLRASLGAKGIEQVVIRRHAIDGARLEAVFASYLPRLDDTIEAAQLEALGRFVIVEYSFGEASHGQLTLKDLWPRLDVQGRNQVHRGNVEFVGRATMQLLRQTYVLHWATTEGGLMADDLQRLRELMADRERRKALALHLGVARDSHRISLALESLKAQVSDSDVATYYAQNMEAFRRIERVRARHIRCADEGCAQSAADELRSGGAFEDVASRRSVAQTRSAGGNLGWIEADSARGVWLHQVALAIPPGAPSAPIREPEDTAGGPGWQIVRVDERITGYHEANSEAVRFVAAEAIAERRAVEEYTALKERLVEAMRVRSRAVCAVNHSLPSSEAGQ